MVTLHSYRRCALLVLIALLVSWLPGMPAAARLPNAALDAPPASVALPPEVPAAQQPVPIIVPPATDPRLPTLTLQLAVAPDPLAVGETATISVTITNRVPDRAGAVLR